MDKSMNLMSPHSTAVILAKEAASRDTQFPHTFVSQGLHLDQLLIHGIKARDVGENIDDWLGINARNRSAAYVKLDVQR